MEQKREQPALQGKLKIQGLLRLVTGMHIGASSDFAPIGAVDSPFIRDTVTKQPIIPGSSLKGKMRTLLARRYAKSYVLQDIDKDPDVIKRLFGSSGKNYAQPARLQFWDLKMNSQSAIELEQLSTDTYMGEIKFENTINRLTASANPRQIERVPAGAVFDFVLVYNIEQPDEVEEDMKHLACGLNLLELDYLGGHGSRGYGRVAVSDITIEPFFLQDKNTKGIDLSKLEHLLQEGKRYEV